jgi:hypothetical protein
VQIGVNQDPPNASTSITEARRENLCERFFWACQDSNYNVLGLVYATGVLAERYEYTPYGKRTVYSRGWLLGEPWDDRQECLPHFAASTTADATVHTNEFVTKGSPTGMSMPLADLDGDGDVELLRVLLASCDAGGFVYLVAPEGCGAQSLLNCCTLGGYGPFA